MARRWRRAQRPKQGVFLTSKSAPPVSICLRADVLAFRLSRCCKHGEKRETQGHQDEDHDCHPHPGVRFVHRNKGRGQHWSRGHSCLSFASPNRYRACRRPVTGGGSFFSPEVAHIATLGEKNETWPTEGGVSRTGRWPERTSRSPPESLRGATRSARHPRC